MLPRVTSAAITGMGLVSAAGLSLQETLGVLGNDAALPEPIPPPFATEFTFPVFRCPAENSELSPVSPGYSRTVALTLRAAYEALADAHLDPHELPALRVGVSLGTSVGASLDFRDFYMQDAAGGSPDLMEIEQYLASNPAPALARLLGCRGPVQTVTNACSSGADAIGIAVTWLCSGICDFVLAGGADGLSPVTYAGFSNLRLPSQTACRPFDAERDGLTLGEGAGIMLLESEASFRKRRIRVHARIAGYGTSTDAYHLTAPHPEALGLERATAQAFDQAGVCWKEVAFINAHGTATKANDQAEAFFFRKHCPDTPFIATKGATGHTLGAAGAVEAILTASHLYTGRLPASPRFLNRDTALEATPISRPLNVHGRFAVSQSLAFGGNNSVLVLARGDV